jgi:hypothetical protein
MLVLESRDGGIVIDLANRALFAVANGAGNRHMTRWLLALSGIMSAGIIGGTSFSMVGLGVPL